MPRAASGEVTRLLNAWNSGDEKALDELTPLVYRELRALAASCLRRERREHTLQPTALVHEAYLRLVDQTRIPATSHAQFLAIAAHLMRQILVNHAKRRDAYKRSRGKQVTLHDAAGLQGPAQLNIVILDEALHKLAAVDPRQSQIVEMRFFGGLKEEEIADVLGISLVTVKRDWRIAKAILHHELTSR